MSHAAYNQTLIQNKQEELLLNLVRLRYRDTPFFLDTASVTATFKSESKVGLGAAIPFSGSVTGLDSSGSATLSVAPTVSYVPIEGDEYFKNFLTPISLDELLVMTQSGWGIDRIFGIAVEQINGLYNATAASGPTPANAPTKASQMEQVLQVLRRAQLNDSLNWAKDSQVSFMSTIVPRQGLRLKPTLSLICSIWTLPSSVMLFLPIHWSRKARSTFLSKPAPSFPFSFICLRTWRWERRISTKDG